MRIAAAAVAVALLGAPGCLLSNTISGSWTGCNSGDDIYVNVPSGHGPIVAEHVACEEGGFDIGVPADHHDFTLELDRHDADYNFINSIDIELVDIDSDHDVGLVVF
jgi:hypothetical protein